MLQLLVIPSFTEGLPNIILEAMACGTPVLATSVGAIPDIIKDGETGYIMENNSPVCIAENITRVLGDPDREKIAMNARKMVESDFTFDTTVTQWKRILLKNEPSIVHTS
jgi:glycosyltransferase involved in cell wall biosynthesis